MQAGASRSSKAAATIDSFSLHDIFAQPPNHIEGTGLPRVSLAQVMWFKSSRAMESYLE